jgi:large subunit ribosomal protein L15
VAINGFEGGQMPLHMRIPKRGFNNVFAKDYAEVNLGMIQKAVDAGKLDAKALIDQAALDAANLTRGGKDGVRVLGKGELKAKLNFTVAGASKSAVAAVEKAGGTVTIPTIVPANEKHAAKHRKTQEAKKAAAKAKA